MPPLPQPAELYEQDFYAWTQLQARARHRLAATRPNTALDLPHLAEEIAELGEEQVLGDWWPMDRTNPERRS